ncbi:hypothetical protein RRG08_054131 [Elysia crispata]|uniref:Uncharacterized protein n=1 Tax=Elysia crispata TaxID=231223 RepID=A0AAE1CTQ9_9GAST|nr:hypothetical protein RRG08_054131 [Elysia crispata]
MSRYFHDTKHQTTENIRKKPVSQICLRAQLPATERGLKSRLFKALGFESSHIEPRKDSSILFKFPNSSKNGIQVDHSSIIPPPSTFTKKPNQQPDIFKPVKKTLGFVAI